MTDKKTPPREFFVYEIPSENPNKPCLRVIRTKIENAFNSDWLQIHCIEKSAYDALAAELAKWKAAAEELYHAGFSKDFSPMCKAMANYKNLIRGTTTNKEETSGSRNAQGSEGN